MQFSLGLCGPLSALLAPAADERPLADPLMRRNCDLVAEEVVTTAVMKTATGDYIEEIVCPECSGVSRCRHRDGRGGGFAYLTHRDKCPRAAVWEG